MAKRMTLRSLALCLIAFAVLGVFLSRKSFAQEQRRKFNQGEMVETGGGITAKILQCRGAGDNEECDVQYYRGDAPESTPRWENADFLRRAEERVLDYKKRQVPNQPEGVDMNRAKAKPAEVTKLKENETNEQVIGECSFTSPASDGSKPVKPSELLFKQKIYERHNAFANGTGSAPLKVGVRFLSFQVGKPFTNTVRVDPARGALRINDAAPVNATIYPVKSEHIVCDQYRDGIQRKRVENKYACFKNRDGEWVCGPDGIPKITQLK